MMRILPLLLSLVIVLSFTAGGEALTQEFETKHYTLKLPSNWIIDTDNLEFGRSSWDLGYLYASEDDGLCVYASLEYLDEWKDVSLWNEDESGLSSYVQNLLEQYDSYGAEYTETVYAGKIPFVIAKLSDSDGVFYWAETMTNGYVVGFELYATKSGGYRDVDKDEYELFTEILKTLKPIL